MSVFNKITLEVKSKYIFSFYFNHKILRATSYKYLCNVHTEEPLTRSSPGLLTDI